MGAGTPVVGRRHSREISLSVRLPGPASVAVADGSAGSPAHSPSAWHNAGSNWLAASAYPADDG